jgi:hypothetical protein
MRFAAKGLALALALGLLAGPVTAQQPVAPLPAVGPVQMLAAVLPMEAAGFVRGSIVDFARDADDPGLGAAIEYRPPSGAGVATVYYYDRGLSGLPDGATGPAVQQEVQLALGEIQAVAAVRRYTVAQVGDMPSIAGRDGQAALRCTAMLLVYEGGRQTDSYLCVGVVHGRFLKLRATLPVGQPGANQQRMLEFGQTITAAVERAE